MRRSYTGRFVGLKRVFLIFLTSYIIMLMLPAAGILYLYTQFTEATERNCAQSAISSIEETSALLRARLSWMDNTASRFLLDSDLTGMIFADPLKYGDTRVRSFNAFSKHLNDRIGIYDAQFLGYRMFFQDSGLIFYEDNISTGLRFYFDTSLNYPALTYEEWYEAVFASDQKKLLPMQDIVFGKATVRALTYNYPLIRRSAEGSRKAVLQFFIQSDRIIPTQFDPQSTIYLLTMDGTVLAEEGAQTPFPSDVELTDDTGWLRHKDDVLSYTEVNGDLRLAMLVPKAVAFQDVIRLRTPMMLVFLFCAIVEGLLSWYLAKRNAKPIETLASDMNQMLNTPRQVNEFEYLQQGILQLQQDRQMAEITAARNKQVETALLLNKVFFNRIDDMDALLRSGNQLGVDLRAQVYCVAIVALPDAVGELAFPALSGGGIRLIICEGSRKSLYLLYMSDAVHMPETDQIVESHLRRLYALLPRETQIGMGRCCEALQDVFLSYNQALFCLQGEAPQSGVILFEQISPDFNSLRFPLEQQQRILNAVKHCSPAIIDREFDALLHENTVKRHLSSLLKRTLLSSVEALLLMAAEDTTLDKNLSDYLRSIHQSNDFHAELDILRGEFKKLAQQMGERHSQQAATQKRDMQAYIEENYADSMLSIGNMAEHFGFSESYFSVLFKDLLGEPYSVYLEKFRLDHAEELLKQTELTVEEVSQRVGYNNSTTFRRAFKRVTGISPQQFRN